jgi:hypothetical protein
MGEALGAHTNSSKVGSEMGFSFFFAIRSSLSVTKGATVPA